MQRSDPQPAAIEKAENNNGHKQRAKSCCKGESHLPMKAANQRHTDDRVTAATRPLHLHTNNTLGDSGPTISKLPSV